MANETWREVTEADLLTVIDNEELNAYRERGTTEAGADPVAALIENAVQECRDRIRANRDNKLAPGSTLPPGVIARCLVIIRHRVLTLLKISIGEDRRAEYEAAERFLSDVAKGLVAVSQPVTETEEAPPAKPRPSYFPKPRGNIYGI